MDQNSQHDSPVTTASNGGSIGGIVTQFLEEQRWLGAFIAVEIVFLGFAFVVDALGSSPGSGDGILISEAIVGTTVAFAIFIGALGIALAIGLFVLFVRSGAWKRG